MIPNIPKVLIYGTILLTSAYIVMGYGDSIAMYYSSVVICGIGLGMVRPANSSGISISQEPEFQGEAAGHLGSVFPIGHILYSMKVLVNFAEKKCKG